MPLCPQPSASSGPQQVGVSEGARAARAVAQPAASGGAPGLSRSRALVYWPMQTSFQMAELRGREQLDFVGASSVSPSSSHTTVPSSPGDGVQYRKRRPSRVAYCGRPFRAPAAAGTPRCSPGGTSSR